MFKQYMNQHQQAIQHAADRAADLGAAVSTTSVAAYTFTNFINDTAIIVAILSGSLAAAWHIYKFYQEYKLRRGKNDSQTDKE